MRLSKTLQDAVHFANFAKNHDIAPLHLAHLITLTKRAFDAGEREANTGSDAAERRADAARRKVEGLANRLGYSTSWPGLAPSFTIEKDSSAPGRIDSLPML